MEKSKVYLTLLLITATGLAAGCASPTPQVVPQTVIVPQTQVIEKAVTTTPPAATAAPAPTQAPAAQAVREVTALVGAGQDTEQVMRFFPQSLTVRAGDTITWKINGDEIHTVSFIGNGAYDKVPPTWLAQDSGDVPGKLIPGFIVPQPDAKSPADVMFDPLVFFPTRQQGGPAEHWSGTGFINSGVLGKTAPPFLPPNTPPNDKFSVVFDKPGSYQFVCLIHLGAMRGTVTVLPSNAPTVPSQSDIDAQAQKEIQPMLGIIKAAEGESQQAKDVPGPKGSTIHHVHAGASDFVSGDITAQSMQFWPQVLTIKAGDTVVWASTYVHTVTFKPTPPPPPFAVVKPQANGPPMLLPGPEVFVPSNPSPTYDPTKYFNSADIGLFGANGTSWSLTFDKPGTYDYFCALHVQLGMKGTIVVQ